jgi:hypothetical protein
MSDRFTEVLTELYSADQWLRPERRDVYLFAFGFRPFEVNGLPPQELQVYQTPPSFEMALDQDQQRPIRTTEWTLFDGGAMLVLTAYECDSREAARAVLLRLLGGFQVASPQRMDLGGELAFVVPSGLTGAMVRGNMAFFVHNGTAEGRSVPPLLETIDLELTREPSGDGDLDIHVGPPTPGFGVRVVQLPAPEEHVWYRFLVHGGEIRKGEDALSFTPDPESDGAVLFVEQISPEGTISMRIEIG